MMFPMTHPLYVSCLALTIPFFLSIPQGKKMEFVMTNGENDWDSPGRYTDKPKNYAITAPGNYKLKSGKLELLP
jgi:hypothetical protein